MADGFSLNIDDKFLRNLEQADRKIASIAQTSEDTSNRVIKAFQDVNNIAFKPLIENLNGIRKALNEKATPIVFKEINTQASQSIDKVNSFITLMNKINNVDAGKTKNSAITKVNDEIEEAKKRLYELQSLLNFYAKGEGKKAIGFVDTSAMQTEARLLMNRIDTLEREKEHLQANARLRMEIAKRQEERDNRWQSMQNEKDKRERESVELANRNAKQSSKAYIESYEERYRMYRKMFDEIQKKESSLHKRQRQINQKYGDSSKGALNYFDRLYSGFKPLSLNNMQTAISKLQDAQKRLDLTTEEGIKKYAELDKRIQLLQRNINATTNSINNMGKSHRGLMDTVGQLTRKLALVFSVSQIQGYIGKLIQVRGEFELQQKSLQVLLQSKDEADKLWQQTIDLAVRSPFRVKELVSYTRQLAAYRVETSKLHETTKMLADVSAGLGVDMNRIILAFGQVRAANFLRGTELRQFTEAGIPMLDELAKLFTELEGRMVSAGDVFERISKRMVTFSDVEEVFTRMTNAGGVFYNMQEEQSKTLQGMISNLRDSIDLMLNDIGKANDGLLKGSVDAAKNFVENWREIAFYIENAVIALASWKIANAAFIIGSQKATTTTLWFNSALKANIGSSMRMIKILKWSEAALVGVTKQQWLLGKATMYLQGILRGIGKFAIRTIVPLAVISGVIELYRHLTKASREAKELQKALNEIYTEDSSNLERQTNVFKDLVERLQKVNVGSKEHKDIISQLNSQYGEYLGFLVTEKTTYDEIATSVNSVVEALRQKTKAQTFEKSFSKILEDNIKEINTLQSDIEEKVSKIGVYRSNNKPALMPTISELDDIFALYEQKVKKANKLINTNELFSEYYGESIQIASVVSDKFAQIGRKILEQKTEEDKLQQRLNGLYGDGVYSTKQMREEMDALNKEREQALKADKTRIGQEKIEYDYLVKKTKLEGKYQGLEQSVIDANVAKLQKTSETIRDINRRIIESTDELGSEAVDRVYITAQDASQGVNAIAESMAAGYKSMQEEIKNQNALKEAGTVHDQKSLDNAETMSKAYYKVLEIMGRLDLLKAKGEKKESAIKILNNRINLIKEINKEYEKLNEKFDATKAKEQVLNAYKDTFKDAFEGTGIKFSGLVIDKNKLIEEGKKSGEVFSEEMVKKMNEVIKSGTYIRSSSDKFKEELKKDEGVLFQLYDDSTKKIIKNTKDFQNAVGTVTIGWGHAIKNIDEAAKYFGKTISEQEAQDIFDKDVDKHVQALNKVLDKYQDLILTQEQYDSLLNATFQGGGGMISSAINYAMDIDKGIKHFDLLDVKLKKVGKTFSEEFGSDFIERFKNAETATERLALALETVGLTTVASGSNIDTNLYKGMKKRAQERAAEFRGDLEIVQLLQRSAINVSQIDFTNIKGVIDTLKQLEPIAKKEGKEAELALSKAISQLEAEVGLNVKIKDDKTLIDYVESLFGDYEVSLELEKMNIPPDLAKQLFNIDALTLSELKNKLIELKPKFEGKEMLEEWDKLMKKIGDKEDKEQEERLKKYTKYLLKAQSERVKIKLEEMRQFSEIDKEDKYSQDQKETIKRSLRIETQEKLDKEAWDEFKNSEMYTQMFEDLETLGNKAIDNLLDNLENLKDSLKNLPANEVKEIMTQINKLSDIKNKRNPFASLRDAMKEVRALEAQGKTEESLQLELQAADARVKSAQNEINAIDTILNAKREGLSLDSQSVEWQNKYGQYVGLTVDMLEEQKRELGEIVDHNKNISEQSNKGLSSYAKARNALKAVHSEWESIRNMASKAYDSIKTILESMGVEADSTAMVLADMGMSLVDLVFQAISFGVQLKIMTVQAELLGVAINSALGPIGWAVLALQAIATVFSGILGLGDAKKERRIKKEQEAVEKLQRAYEKLEKAIDNAYNINSYERYIDNAQQNLKNQIAATERMIQAEEDKKKTDKDKIKDWKNEIEDMKDALKELEEDRVKGLGGFGSESEYKSATEEFVSAWLDAYKETGDGLSGLEEQFNEFFTNMVKNQLMMRGVDRYLDGFYKQFDAMFAESSEQGGKVTKNELESLKNLWASTAPGLNEFMENLIEGLGIAKDLTSGTSELSGLQRGIQGVTEETAQIIEAYLNSIRFMVASNNTYLSQIASAFGNTEVENPMVGQLRIIAQQTAAINTLLQSLTRGGHSLGGVGLKVFIS